MTKRDICDSCARPLKTCICKHISAVTNHVPIIILQHPQEAREAKNSAGLLHLCLKNSQIEIGEIFTDSFFQAQQAEGFYDLLLYPDTPEEKSLGLMHPPAIDPAYIALKDKPIPNIRLWVLDATWRKSRKMLYLNPSLQAMPRVNLKNTPPSIYTIRKAHSENQLSTLEASCYALQQLEHNAVDYSPIFNSFAAFIAEQHSFLPSAS